MMPSVRALQKDAKDAGIIIGSDGFDYYSAKICSFGIKIDGFEQMPQLQNGPGSDAFCPGSGDLDGWPVQQMHISRPKPALKGPLSATGRMMRAASRVLKWAKPILCSPIIKKSQPPISLFREISPDIFSLLYRLDLKSIYSPIPKKGSKTGAADGGIRAGGSAVQRMGFAHLNNLGIGGA